MTLDTLEARLAAAMAGGYRSDDGSGPDQRRTQAFVRAAAVLWQFAPEELVPDDDAAAAPHEAADLLAGKLLRLRPDQDGRVWWTLRDSLRPPALAGLGGERLAALRARYGGSVAPAQALVDRWLTGRDERLADYDTDDLGVLCRLHTWFDPPLAHLPTEDQLERLRATARFRAPLRALASHELVGRTAELRQLDGFVYGPSDAVPALLVVHGTGGVGKSTLAAKFLLAQVSAGDPHHLLAYLDLDDATLDIGDSVGLLVEITAQTAAQLPDVAELDQVARGAARAAADLAAGRGRGPGRAMAAQASTMELAEAYGDALTSAGAVRLTLVFDTFAQFEYASLDDQRFLLELLTTLHARVPSLRTIVVSRARLEVAGAVHLELGDLDAEAARSLLGSRGVTDDAQVTAAIALSWGNPLSLKLIADLIKRDGAAALDGLERPDPMHDELLQGELYRRILQRVPDRQVQMLAHPSMVLRRITPAIIQHVLAGPCGVSELDDAQARVAFDRLAQESALVRIAADGTLEPRPEVRRVMLPTLRRDRPRLVRELHARAAAHYEAGTDDSSIAETAYHHFSLGDVAGPWLDRLTPEAAIRLRESLDELPEACWPLIASMAKLDLPETQWGEASADARERRLADRVRDLLAQDRAEDALELVERQPPQRDDSPLWRWQGRALALVGKLGEAKAALARAVAGGGTDDDLREDRRLLAEVGAKLAQPTAEGEAAACADDDDGSADDGVTRAVGRDDATVTLSTDEPPAMASREDLRIVTGSAAPLAPAPRAPAAHSRPLRASGRGGGGGGGGSGGGGGGGSAFEHRFYAQPPRA